MLLYVFLILLPATALAQCSEGSAAALYEAIDENVDGYIEPREADAFVKDADENQDGVLTLDEALVTLPQLVPDLEGRVEETVYFWDANDDGVITRYDVNEAFVDIDTDRDGSNSRKEYDTYIANACGAK